MQDFSMFVPNVHFEQIPIKNLVSNQDYQRNLSKKHIEKAAENFDLYMRPYTRNTTVWEDALQQVGGFLDAWQDPSDPAKMEAACDNAGRIIRDAIG